MAKKKENVEIIKDASENAIFNKETEGLSQGQIVRKRFFRHRACGAIDPTGGIGSTPRSIFATFRTDGTRQGKSL